MGIAKSNIEQEFVTLLNKHQAILCKVCWLFSRGEQSVYDDLRQELATALWHEFRRFRLSRIRHQDREPAWIYSIALYTAIHYTRHYSRTSSLITFLPDPTAVESSPSLSDDADSVFELIETLPVSDRRWIAYYLDGYDYRSIAQMEGTTEVAARKRMSRIMEKIRQMKV